MISIEARKSLSVVLIKNTSYTIYDVRVVFFYTFFIKNQRMFLVLILLLLQFEQLFHQLMFHNQSCFHMQLLFLVLDL